MQSENLCACCGEKISENRQICRKCESEYKIKWGDSIMQKVYEKGFRDGQQDILVSRDCHNVAVKVSRSELKKIFMETIGEFIFQLNEKLKIICGHCIMDLMIRLFLRSSAVVCQKKTAKIVSPHGSASFLPMIYSTQ